MLECHKTDSGLFIIAALTKNGLQLFTFPINNEYLEMMTEVDLFKQYAPRVAERLQNA
jgi:hypothetical protein